MGDLGTLLGLCGRSWDALGASVGGLGALAARYLLETNLHTYSEFVCQCMTCNGTQMRCTCAHFLGSCLTLVMPLGHLLGALGAVLGPLGPLLGGLEPLLGRSWAVLGRSWAILEPLGRSLASFNTQDHLY